jgi:uncharacterized protein YbjT (DUF2867 family)
MKVALVIGASGMIGKECVYRLAEDNYYQRIIILVRKELPLKHHKIQQQVVDFEKLENYSSYFRVDAVFCCLGTTISKAITRDRFYEVDCEYVVKSAQLAKQSGVEKFLVVSALGANEDATVFYNRVKGTMERMVSEVGFSSLHILRPSLLLGNRLEFRFGERVAQVLMKLLGFLFVGPIKKYKAIEASSVAIAMIALSKESKQGVYVYESNVIASIAKKGSQYQS